MQTHWTEARLKRLFDRYDRKFWRGRLKSYTVKVKDLSGRTMGTCDNKLCALFIDTAKHRTDREIRATLLHEMAHAATPKDYPAHGYQFWGQLEMLLRKGATVSIGFAEAGPLVKVLKVPKRFKLCRKLAERANMRRNRELKQLHPEPPIEMTEEMLLQEIENFAGATFQQALVRVAEGYGMVDIGGKPLWPRSFVTKARSVHARARRDHLDYLRRVRARDLAATSAEIRVQST